MSGELDFLTITTPLPDSSFTIAAIAGSERLSRPFRYEVQLHAGSALIDPDSLLDQSVTVAIAKAEGGEAKRYVNGIVSSIRQFPSASAELWRYEISVVPKLWLLGQTKDCRFYEKQSALDIVIYVLSKFNVLFSDKTSSTFPVRDYLVQFNESYLDFIQRLMEDSGIFYFFTHRDGMHMMVLADANTAFVTVSEPEIHLDETHGGFGALNSWNRTDRTVMGSVRIDDYDPLKDQLQPGAVSGTESTILKASAAPERSYYVWPAKRGTTSEARQLAKTRMLAAEAGAQLYAGTGQLAALFVGGKFVLMNDPITGSDTEYVVQSLNYQVVDASAGIGQGGSTITTSFVAFPSQIAFYEEPVSLPPVMAGIYSAIVIGPGDEEIYTDDEGRIQVRFPFDHEDDITTDKTLWVRVMQGWSGNQWGTQYIPRIGMEVVVAFLEGDVNRPVVVGCLFNNSNKPVFAASEKNKSGLRTRSTQGGGAANFSEFSIDDTKGSEVVFLHAEKDLNVVAEQTITLKVANNSIVIDTSSITLTVGESMVKLTASELDVKGIQVNIQGQAKTAVEAAIVQVSGEGMLELKGGITMINS